MIINIAAYHFFQVDDVDALRSDLRVQAEQHDLLGTVLVAPEGLNLFLAGDAAGIEAFLDWLRAHCRLPDLTVKFSNSRHRPFARLKVKRKREIIAFRQDHASPLQRPRASAVQPSTLRRWIAQGSDDAGRPLRLLDTRNREELAYGAFENALILPIDNFTDLPAAIDHVRDTCRDATVVSYCTGGIRCEKAALWLNQHGFEHVLQLEGGILGYFESEGGYGFRGDCFVFDERIALRPDLSPLLDEPVAPLPALNG